VPGEQGCTEAQNADDQEQQYADYGQFVGCQFAEGSVGELGAQLSAFFSSTDLI